MVKIHLISLFQRHLQRKEEPARLWKLFLEGKTGPNYEIMHMTSHHEPLILHSRQSTQSYCKCSINLCLATPHSTHLTHDTSVFTEIILGIAIWRLKRSSSNISPTLNRKDPIYLLTNREHFTSQVYSSIKEATKRPDKPVTQGSW